MGRLDAATYLTAHSRHLEETVKFVREAEAMRRGSPVSARTAAAPTAVASRSAVLRCAGLRR